MGNDLVTAAHHVQEFMDSGKLTDSAVTASLKSMLDEATAKAGKSPSEPSTPTSPASASTQAAAKHLQDGKIPATIKADVTLILKDLGASL